MNSKPADLNEPVASETVRRLMRLADLGMPRWLQLVADAGVANALGEAPETAEALAHKTGLNADALHRVMFMLCSHGIFSYAGGRFAHTPMSLILRSDHPQSQRGMIRLSSMMQPPTMPYLGEVLRTGRPYSHGDGDLFARFAKDPSAAQIFNEAMTAKSNADIAAILTAYDFSQFSSIADVGGGRGHLIRAVLQQTPRAEGILFDLPHAIESQRAISTPRLRLEAGDFFKGPLPECKAYLLMNVIHDWDDERAVTILKSVRKAAPSNAKVLLLETLLPEEPNSSLAVQLDLTMMAIAGGRERTPAQYEALLRSADLKLNHVITAASGMSILEAVPSS